VDEDKKLVVDYRILRMKKLASMTARMRTGTLWMRLTPCRLGMDADTNLYIHTGPYSHSHVSLTGLFIQPSAKEHVDMQATSKTSKLAVTGQALISDHSIAHMAKYAADKQAPLQANTVDINYFHIS
jgi:hypothetical protein